MNPRAFVALPGTEPVDMDHNTGCRWPIETEGRTLFCNSTPSKDSANKWCVAHCRIGYAPRSVTKRGN